MDKVLNTLKKFSKIGLVLRIYLLVLGIFSVFRVILFLTEFDRVNIGETNISTIISAFIMGVRFDVVISGYIIFIPAFFYILIGVFIKKNRFLHKVFFYWVLVLFILAFSISAADIPYFNQFYSRFSIGAFEWLDNIGFVTSMILQEPKYYLFLALFLVLIVFFYFRLRRIFKTEFDFESPNIIINIIISLLFLALMFLGVRGRIEKKSPIRIGTAFFSNNSFLNKLGLNPVFTLMRSYLDSLDDDNKTINLIDDDEALSNVKTYLNITGEDYDSPIARRIIPDSINPNKPNIIIIIMESMSAAKMKRHGNTHNLTPFLDSLSHNSIYFENIYTAGKHTFNGIFGTQFSFPAIFRQHPMKQIRKYDGLASVLEKLGYSTSFFITHDSQFDNASGFLRANNFHSFISQEDYPKSEIKSTLGVPDDYMFRFSITHIDELYKKNKPFLVSYMTTSDHIPYIIPDYFKPKNSEPKYQITEYSDWSLKQFISQCSKKEWFDNTIFVFVADHGAPISSSYEISLDYHHSPLIYYAPKLLGAPKSISKIGGQIDVFPTIMGLLKQSYVNNTLGIDLLHESRPYIFINDDDKIGVLSDSLFLIIKGGEKPKLFKYLELDKKNYAESFPEVVKEMKNYAESNLQTYQYMLRTNKTTIQNNID